MLRSLFPGLKVYGGLVLNRQAGGLNPDAAERMAQAGGKYLWFPTWYDHCIGKSSFSLFLNRSAF